MRCCKKQKLRTALVLEHQRSPNLSHHSRRRNWLVPSVPERNRTTAFSSSPRQKARSLPKWNCHSRPISTSLKLRFRTRPRFASISSRVSKLCLRLRVGNLAATNRSNAGDLFTADRLAFKTQAGLIEASLALASFFGEIFS